MRHMLALGSMLGLFVANESALASVPPVPRTQQRELKTLLAQIGAPDLALVPTSAPAHFAFESYSVSGSPPGLDVSLTDTRFRKTKALPLQHEISFDIAYFNRPMGRCSSGSRETLTVGAQRIYSDGGSVWRCLRTTRGRVVIAAAHGHLGLPALAALVESARPVQ